jgi:hypothetical protein
MAKPINEVWDFYYRRYAAAQKLELQAIRSIRKQFSASQKLKPGTFGEFLRATSATTRHKSRMHAVLKRHLGL